MSLDELTNLLKANGASATTHYALNETYQDFLTNAKKTLSDPRSYMLINYYRKSLNLPGGGHIRPLVAYDKKNDAFLLLEVSRYKYPPLLGEIKKPMESYQYL